MKFNKWVKSVTAAVVLSLALSVTAFGAETDADELTMVTSEQTEMKEGMVGAGAHASIYPDPTMYDATFSNNTKINLLFNVRTFGNDMERYEIRIFKGSTESSANLVARKNADFVRQREHPTLHTAGTQRITANTRREPIRSAVPHFIILQTGM